MLKRKNKPLKQFGNVVTNFCGLLALGITISIGCILIVAFHSTLKKNETEYFLQTKPIVEFVNGTELISEKPPDSPKAVLFLAHGCGGRAGNFWFQSPSCPHCIGLPEETRLVHEALARGFAVIAISSKGNCWSHGEEMFLVRDAIEWWVEKNGFSEVPLTALGASSGGYFVSMLANQKHMRFSSIVIMIAEGLFGLMDVTREDYPPTLFVHMPKDRRRNDLVLHNIQILKQKGIEAEEVKCLELPLTPRFLGNRIEGIDQATSISLYELLREKGFIDANGFMKKDGRRTPWVKALKESKIFFPNKKLSTRHVQEELNLAFAYHEMTSLQSKEIFGWFESHMRRAQG